MTATSTRPGTKPDCEHQPFCGDGESDDGWLCGRCTAQSSAKAEMLTADDPEPDHESRIINRNANCKGCFKPFVMFDDAVTYELTPGRWIRYHPACWPWATEATTS